MAKYVSLRDLEVYKNLLASLAEPCFLASLENRLARELSKIAEEIYIQVELR